MREPKLREIQESKVKFNKQFVNKIIRRIECTVPLAGNNITTKELDSGIEISANFNVVTLNVCSNGTPAELVVLTPSEE